MVTIRALILTTLLFFTPIFSWGANDVRVAAQIDQDKIVPNLPIRGTITIQHDVDEQVDTSSFRMQGSPLNVEFIRDVEISPHSPIRISFYQFELKPQDSGLHVLPSISVTVGGKSYTSTAITYEVPQTVRAKKSTGGIVLELEAFVASNKPLYIGQKTIVGYRIYYNTNFDLKDQQLPLLNAKGFKKIGGERISDLREGVISIRQIEQEIQAIEAGSYTFGPSYIVGYRTRQDNRGRSRNVGMDVKAEAPVTEIVVRDFPEEGKPSSFNGSVGENIDFSVELLSRPTVYLGDKISLSLTFTSDNDLSGVTLPELCCQPGFPGFFELGDIPPVPSNSAGSVRYFVELRPLTDTVKNVPAIEFSYFNPQSQKYAVLRSDPIPLNVKPAPAKALPMAPELPTMPDVESPPKSSSSDWPKQTPKTRAIEIETIYPLNVSDLHDRYFGTWITILIIPFGFLALYIQMDIIKRRRKREESIAVKKSVDMLNEAKAAKEQESEFYHLLEKALMMRLYEAGQIETTDISYHSLPKEGVSGKVRNFIFALEEARFSRKREKSPEEIIKYAEKLIDSIEENVNDE